MRPNKIAWVLVAGFLAGGIAFTIAAPGIFLGEIWIGVSLFLAGVYTFTNRRADRFESLMQEGIPGEAQILDMTQTGMYLNGMPRVRLKLRVQAPGVPAFETERTYTVPQIGLGSLTGGRALRVYLDRAHSSKFAIDWFAHPLTARVGG